MSGRPERNLHRRSGHPERNLHRLPRHTLSRRERNRTWDRQGRRAEVAGEAGSVSDRRLCRDRALADR